MAFSTYCLFCPNLKVEFLRNLMLTKILIKAIIIMGENRVVDTIVL